MKKGPGLVTASFRSFLLFVAFVVKIFARLKRAKLSAPAIPW